MDTLVGLMAQPLSFAAGGPVLDLDASLLIQVALFVILWVGLTYLVFKPYLSARHERENLTEGTRARATELQTRIQRVVSDCDTQLKAARERAAELRASALREASSEASSIRDVARQRAQSTQQQGLDALAASAADARVNLSSQAHQLSTSIVEKVLTV